MYQALPVLWFPYLILKNLGIRLPYPHSQALPAMKKGESLVHFITCVTSRVDTR